MHHRSKLVLAVGALLLATPALSSCGFNLATDRVNTVQHGGTNRDASVDVLAVVIVSGGPGSGTLSGRIVNNSTKATELGTVSALDDPESTATEVEPVEIPAGGALAMADIGDGIRVEGDFAPGDVVNLTFEFGNGERVEVEVPVVRQCGIYEGLDSAPTAGEESTAPSDEASAETEEPEGYSCDAPEQEEH